MNHRILRRRILLAWLILRGQPVAYKVVVHGTIGPKPPHTTLTGSIEIRRH